MSLATSMPHHHAMPRHQSLELITKKILYFTFVAIPPYTFIFCQLNFILLMSNQIHPTVTCIVGDLQNYQVTIFYY